MNVLLTGSTGFIGRNVLRELNDRGHEVCGFDRSDGFDIRNREQILAGVENADVVIHLAGILGTSEILDGLDEAIDVNIAGTTNVLRACKEHGARYVGITMPDCWPSAYQATKLAGTRLAAAFENAYDLSVSHVRTFNVYGPGQAHGPGHPQKILPTFASCAHERRPLPIWGDGSNTVDLVHVDDVATTFADMVERIDYRGTADCGTGIETSVVDVARLVCAAAGVSTVLELLPMRAGELDGTRLAASQFGPFQPGKPILDDPRFSDAVEAYRPIKSIAA